MIFLQLFYIFSKIGIFNFGGGYAMLSLIQNDTVVKNHWLTNAEFTDIVAISQSTPGPIGINAATYVGYTAVLHAGYPHWGSYLRSRPGLNCHHVALFYPDDMRQQISSFAQEFT